MTSVVGELPAVAGEHALVWPGPAGDLALRLSLPDSEPQGVAVICHPHSLMGGSMDNKVVFTLHRAFRDAGWITLRFNFRGVGSSQGVFDHGVGEQQDVLAVLTVLKANYPDLPLWLAGFSFGSFVSLSAWSQVVKQGWLNPRLMLVAPPVQRFPLGALAVPAGAAIVFGDADEVVSPEDMAAWVSVQQAEHELLVMPGAGHFFHGRLNELKAWVEDRLM